MIDIKISLPSHGKNLTFENFFSFEKNKEQRYRFHINKDIEKADFWFVFEDLTSRVEYCKVPLQNVIYLNNETSFKKNHFFSNYMIKYLNQFSYSYGCYPVYNKNHTNTFPFLPWMIHANHGDTIYEKSEIDYTYLSKLKNVEKDIELSVICSNKVHTENHSLRIEFLNILREHFGEKMNWYGNGIKSIDKKSDVIFRSKYHIVLENDSKYNLMSEKLFDSYLGISYPIYYGATNIYDYFDDSSLTKIDINDINSSISKIENVINNKSYEKNLDSLINSRDKILNNYNFYNRILKIIEEKLQNDHSKEYINMLYSTGYFWKKFVPKKQKIKKILARKLRI